ncbi:MAG: dihydrolipoamide dehydrogenase [Labilithrix sp.]|nr:dihydrolipoamide dehydrogenase [Labilithrix sp.]
MNATSSTTSDAFDVIVIGSGPGGYHAAIRAAQLGKSVACIDRGRIGGVCVNVGCIPTKALLHVAEVAHQAREASAVGVRISGVEIDVPTVRAFTQRAVSSNVSGLESLFRANGVTVIRGSARFVSPQAVDVENEGRLRRLRASAFVIATGAEPVTIPGFEIDGRVVIDSNDAIALFDIPASLLVVGGGVVGLELAMIHHRLGSKVTVVERLSQILPGVDPEIARTLERIFVKQGIDVMTNVNVSLLDVGARARAELRTAGAETRVLEFDRVLVAVGRRPVTSGLGLDAAGLSVDRHGFIAVDAQRRTHVPGIFAVGDVAGGPLLAHKAFREGVVAAEAIAGERGAAYDPIAVPNCIYTDPQVATAGLTEDEAKAEGRRVKIGKFPLSASGRGRTTNHAEGLVKLVSDADSDLLLGMHIVGPQAESLIGEGVMALEMRATTEDLALSIHPHPTFSEAIHDAAEAALGRAIHLVNRKKQ